MPQYSMTHTAITLDDAEKAADWYNKYFGFEVVRESSKQELRLEKIIMMGLNSSQLEILEPIEPQREKNYSGSLVARLQKPGQNHNALQVDDVNAAYEQLHQESGATILDYVQDNSLWIIDPFGILWEIKQRK